MRQWQNCCCCWKLYLSSYSCWQLDAAASRQSDRLLHLMSLTGPEPRALAGSSWAGVGTTWHAIGAENSCRALSLAFAQVNTCLCTYAGTGTAHTCSSSRSQAAHCFAGWVARKRKAEKHHRACSARTEISLSAREEMGPCCLAAEIFFYSGRSPNDSNARKGVGLPSPGVFSVCVGNPWIFAQGPSSTAEFPRMPVADCSACAWTAARAACSV